MADEPEIVDAEPVKVAQPPKLSRKRTFTFDKDALVKKVLDEYQADLTDRSDWSEMRLQRYAKVRGWLEKKTQPWDNASNVHVPLMMTDIQRMIDTLVNAVIGQRPVMSATAVTSDATDKQETVDDLLDYQLFLEQNGEEKLQHFADSFVTDGTAVAFLPYIKEDHKVSDVRTYPPLQDTIDPEFQLRQILGQAYPGAFLTQTSNDLWGWVARWQDENRQDQRADIEFYTNEDNLLVMVAEREMRLFDGPCFLPKELHDVVVPFRSGNLQAPSPSNPDGAEHVTLVDKPTWDEIKRLQKRGYYNLLTKEDIDDIEGPTQAGDPTVQSGQIKGVGRDVQDPEEHRIQRDTLAGHAAGGGESSTKDLTRLMYFGRYDVDDDGLLEDVVFWVLREPRKLLKVSLLNEMFPALPPRRPFAEARFLPVQGQFYGIGMMELLEHLHDVIKAILDQTIDKNTLVNTPWFLYRAASGMRPEVIKCAPGEGYPVSNPATDMVFPQIPNADQSLSLNLLALFQQWADKQVVIGDLQFGRVPQGKASALRTVSGMMAVLQQGDARPERLLRRFFSGIKEIYQQFHELNQAFLPPKKQYRIASLTHPEKNPYRTLDDPGKIRGRFEFEFKANALNTNKATQAQVLQGLGPILYNEMTFQMGLATPEHVYTWMRKLVASTGQDPHELIAPPGPESEKPKLSADEVLWTIYSGQIPAGVPQEGPQAQLQILHDFLIKPESAYLDGGSQRLLQEWMTQLQRMALQQAQFAQAAQRFAQLQAGGGGQGRSDGAPPDQSALGLAPQGQNQLMDESLPTARGAGF